MKNILTLLSLLSLVGCASAEKEKCEGTDWFRHGYNLAMQGRRVTGDHWIEVCKKHDVTSGQLLDEGFKSGMDNYCKPETTLQIGRSGDPFNFSFCDPAIMGVLHKNHRDGINTYCSKENAFAAGSSGKRYTKMCSKEQEKIFIPLYVNGRRQYLTTEITQSQTRIKQLEIAIASYEYDRSALNNHLAALPQPHYDRDRTCTTNHEGNTVCEERTVTIDPASYERSQVHQRLNDVHVQILNSRTEKADLLQKIKDDGSELETLSADAVSLERMS